MIFLQFLNDLKADQNSLANIENDLGITFEDFSENKHMESLKRIKE